VIPLQNKGTNKTIIMVKIRSKKTTKGSFALYLDIYNKGKRYKEYLKIHVSQDYTKQKNPKPKGEDTKKWALANEVRAEREISLLREGFGFIPASLKKASFIKYFENNAIDTTKKSSLHKLKEFVKGKDILFQEITPQFLEKFKSYLLSQVASSSAHTYFAKMKYVWNKAIKEGIVSNNPFLSITIKKTPKKPIVYLTEEEVKIIFQTKEVIPEVIRQAFLFSCFCGYRISDIRNLKWSNIKDKSIEIVMIKGGEFLSTPLNSTLENILAQRPKDGEYVFGDLPSKTEVSSKLKVLGAYLRFDKNMYFHLARHTFGTLALTKGMDIYEVSKLMGHKGIQMTMHYAKIIDAKKEIAMNKMPNFEI
jgi:integrase